MNCQPPVQQSTTLVITLQKGKEKIAFIPRLAQLRTAGVQTVSCPTTANNFLLFQSETKITDLRQQGEIEVWVMSVMDI